MSKQALDKNDVFIQIQNWIVKYKTTNDEKYKLHLRNLITIALLPFIKDVAWGIARRYTDPIDDLIQSGAIGLIKAIDFYDLNVSQSFKTYATYFILGEMRHYLRDKVTIIKAPRRIQELSNRIKHLLKGISMDGSDLSADKIAEALCVPVEKVNEVFETNRRRKVLSLDEIVQIDCEEYMPLIDKIPDNSYDEDFDLNEAKTILSKAVDKLSGRLKEIIILLYYQDYSQREVSKKLNISQTEVSRRLHRAFERLYDIITNSRNNVFDMNEIFEENKESIEINQEK